MSEQLDNIKAQKNFYRDNFRRASSALCIALILIMLLSLAFIYFYVQRPLPTFYASSSSGDLTSIAPLDSPNYSNTPLIQ